MLRGSTILHGRDNESFKRAVALYSGLVYIIHYTLRSSHKLSNRITKHGAHIEVLHERSQTETPPQFRPTPVSEPM